MKSIATVALILNLSAAGVFAQQTHVKMTFSGTVAPSTTTLQPNTNTDEGNVAGKGTLGAFTFRELHADTPPEPSSTCSGATKAYFATVAGGGVFRFHDGSLLVVAVAPGSSLCIDFDAGSAHLTTTYQITGGTGRFKGASGNLALTATWVPVLFNGPNSAVLLTTAGELDGTVSGIIGEERQDEQPQVGK